MFEQVLRRCIEAGLVGGEGFAVDASVVKADASRQRHHEEEDDHWDGGSRAVSEYLDALHEEGIADRSDGALWPPCLNPYLLSAIAIRK